METNTLPLEKELEPIFLKQLPQFPDTVKDLLVKIAPFLAIFVVVFSVFGVGILALISPLAWFSVSFIYGFGMIFLLISVVLNALAISPLFGQKKQGWKLMYYAQFVATIHSLCMGTWFGALIGAFIGFWILFQVRERYQ